MEEVTVGNDTRQYIVTKLDNEHYGIDITQVENVVRLQPITRVPKSQHFFEGVINLRGEIVPVMNLRKRFDLAPGEHTNATRIMILEPEDNEKIGILVDEVREVVALEENQIEKADYTEQGMNLVGIGKYKDMLISLLNIQSIIQELEG